MGKKSKRYQQSLEVVEEAPVEMEETVKEEPVVLTKKQRKAAKKEAKRQRE